MKKFRKMAVLLTAILLMLAFSATAYADGSGEAEPVAISTPAPTPEPIKPANPFTPAGTGTVVDTATDEDGKEFYTITTADESVFYLVIDLQRGTENVYFLNAVTVEDLLALAENPDAVDKPWSILPSPTPEATPEATPAPQAEQPVPARGGNAGMLIFMLVVALAVGGAGYYFKIYLPKKQRAESEEEAEYAEPDYDADEAEDGDELPPWEDDEGDGEA